ncbi:pantetheine-phosphate adenylyltransferase [Planctomycetota bacterium]
MRRALYPGSFDPITNGHLDLIERGARAFDELIVAVAVNAAKQPLFSVKERLDLIMEEVQRYDNVRVSSFDGLAVEFARRNDAPVILRGIRTFSDFEYELQMAHTNKTLAAEVETIFMVASVEWSFVSARLLKEALLMGARIAHLVPKRVEREMQLKLTPAKNP